MSETRDAEARVAEDEAPGQDGLRVAESMLGLADRQGPIQDRGRRVPDSAAETTYDATIAAEETAQPTVDPEDEDTAADASAASQSGGGERNQR